jgi:hypothetical protein
MSTDSDDAEISGQIAERTREDKLRALKRKDSVDDEIQELAARALARRQEESS